MSISNFLNGGQIHDHIFVEKYKHSKLYLVILNERTGNWKYRIYGRIIHQVLPEFRNDDEYADDQEEIQECCLSIINKMRIEVDGVEIMGEPYNKKKLINFLKKEMAKKEEKAVQKEKIDEDRFANMDILTEEDYIAVPANITLMDKLKNIVLYKR